MDLRKIIVINLGSTSTKIAYVENHRFLVRDNIKHDAEKLSNYHSYNDQYEFRKKAVSDWMEEHYISVDNLDAFACRGGQTEPISGGTWQVNEAMVSQTRTGKYGNHVCNLGPRIALDLCTGHKAIPMTTDTPTMDEMDSIARFSGLKEISRVSCIQALNTKAMARYYAELNHRRFEDIRVIMVMLGGGIAVSAIRDGRLVDAPDALEGEGPFSNNRCGTIPAGQLVKLCYSGRYTQEEMIRHINGEAGLMSYLHTTDMFTIMDKIKKGNEYTRTVLEAMCYQTSKEIGAMAAVLEGKVDAVILIGGMANIEFLVDEIRRRTSFIAPVVVMPGEREMEALAEGALEALEGIRPLQQFIPKEN